MKKTYKAPKLLTYGNLTQMTRTIMGGKGMMDNRFGTRKT